MERIPEPELMAEDEQARAYALADFAEPHNRFIELFRESFPDETITGRVLDLGCGPADVTLRFARAFPDCCIDGVDGAERMLHYGRIAVAQARLETRVRLIHGYLPGVALPCARYNAVISNSLLHHLRDPMVLWDTIKAYARPGAPVFIMDLMRPESRAQAQALVDQYAANEPEVLRHDFFNSLLAAYRIDELAGQLAHAGLTHFTVHAASDRHLTISGRLQP